MRLCLLLHVLCLTYFNRFYFIQTHSLLLLVCLLFLKGVGMSDREEVLSRAGVPETVGLHVRRTDLPPLSQCKDHDFGRYLGEYGGQFPVGTCEIIFLPRRGLSHLARWRG